jgi:benzoyl-CoA reductase/2-hydroxyglutaryl-CoA dehydratase subunit BcrC/BadD/HgdB
MGKVMGKGAGLATLATTLGVDETKLKDAIKAVRDEQKAARQSSGSTTKPDPTAMQDEFATKLAAELGIDAAKVKTALADLRAAAQAEHQKAFDDKLAKAVTDGTLTQAEADAVKKAAKAGIIGMGRGPH